MIFFSFNDKVFNKEYKHSNIYIVISGRDNYDNAFNFIDKAVEFVNDKVYPGENFKSDFEGVKFKEGLYEDIIKHWIDSMDESIEIKFDDITNIHRIKCNNSNPLRDEYLVETPTEYIMFLWSCTE